MRGATQSFDGSEIVSTTALTRTFDQLTAVDHVTLRIPVRQTFGVLGPNGAGKTTTIKMLTTLLPPTSGTAQVAGFDVVREPSQVRASIGYVPQLISSDPGITGRENLRVFASLYAVPRSERARRVDESLEFMGLSNYGDVLVRNYSGGMIRRLEIAQAMLHRPRVLFMDEPTVGLDPIAREAVWHEIGRLRAAFGTSIVLTTHYMEEAEALCDQVAIFHHGNVAAVGSPTELRASLGRPDATLEDVFVHYAGEGMEGGESFRDTRRTRTTTIRLR